ncbi:MULTISPECIES: hypothetical protein [Bacillaceae]|uniref:hypothetical protein n=1 Tax=Bacillaceae TaxID=186817 RepID=UPI000BF8A9A4|nr:hypothetical protein [Bacillus toyonensis]MED3620830.1 hypothetical protein [Bacillus thuringiensis]PGC89358.1 hypothetical protein COM39_15490 [Bacillus toyonensis]HEF7293017.1 hypothetical protein [Bacillus cereus]
MSTEQKVIQDSLKKQYSEEYKTLQRTWHGIDQELFYTCRLAYWTQWVSFHIEHCTWLLKGRMKQPKRQECIKQRQTLYDLKHKAFSLLAQSKYAQLKAFIPPFHRELCDEHKMQIGKQPVHYMLEKMYKEVKECPKCCEGKEQYYSLYAVEIKHEETNTFFLFHVPYFKVKDMVKKDISTLPKLKRYSLDIGVTEISNIKRVPDAFSYKLTVKKFTENLDALSDLINKDKKPATLNKPKVLGNTRYKEKKK